MKNKRLKNILAAGALTGLILATFMAFAWRDTGRADAAATTENQAVTTTVSTEGPDLGALQAENAQLRSALDTMQVREQQYQAQLEVANQTILQLQDRANSVVTTRFDDDHEGHESEHGEFDHD